MPIRAIVDAHHHLWDPAANAYPWLTRPPYPPSVAGDVAPIARPYGVEDFRRDAAGYEVRKTVHVGGGCADALAETGWLSEVRRAYGIPTAIVASATLEAPECLAELEKQLDFPAVKGVRQILNWDPNPLLTFSDRPDHMTDARWREGYALLARCGLRARLENHVA